MESIDQLIERMPKAACVFIWREDGKILAVSRPDDPNAFTLPGGGVDPGESFEQAAARELKEETGLEVTNLHPVFSGIETESDEDHITWVYEGNISGEFSTEETGRIAWVNPSVLVEGPFGLFNRQLFDKLGVEY
jgi:8-oxo-dGTP pyrophosphatase MutT (NUDIX family)